MVGEPGAAEGNEPARARYRSEVHVTLAVALGAICIALGIVGWSLRPRSSGLHAVPAQLAIEVPRSGVTAQEIMMRTRTGGATLDVVAKGTPLAGLASTDDEWTVTIDCLGAGRSPIQLAAIDVGGTSTRRTRASFRASPSGSRARR